MAVAPAEVLRGADEGRAGQEGAWRGVQMSGVGSVAVEVSVRMNVVTWLLRQSGRAAPTDGNERLLLELAEELILGRLGEAAARYVGRRDCLCVCCGHLSWTLGILSPDAYGSKGREIVLGAFIPSISGLGAPPAKVCLLPSALPLC